MQTDLHADGDHAREAAVIRATNAVTPFNHNDIVSFLSSIEKHLRQQGKSHDAWVKANIELVNLSEDAESFAVDGYYQYDGVLPFVLRSSLFVFAYGRFEHSIHTLCKLMQAVQGKKCGPEDLKDRGFVRSRNYLKKVIGIELPEGTGDVLELIGVYGTIRNAIAHSSGILKDDEKAAEAYIRRTDGISLDQDRVIHFEHDFVFDSIATMQEAWDAIFQKCSVHNDCSEHLTD